MLSETKKQKDKKFDKITDDSKSVELKTGTYFMYCNAGKYVIDCFDTAVRKNALTLVMESHGIKIVKEYEPCVSRLCLRLRC